MPNTVLKKIKQSCIPRFILIAFFAGLIINLQEFIHRRELDKRNLVSRASQLPNTICEQSNYSVEYY